MARDRANVELFVPMRSLHARAGDRVAVSGDLAAYLIVNGHARRLPSSLKRSSDALAES